MDLLETLAAEAGQPVPDLDSIERAIRDGSHASGAAALKAILEEPDSQLPAPICERCGRAMARHGRKSRTIVTRLGPVSIERIYRYCRDCSRGHFPLDRVLGIEGDGHSPGAASLMADVVGDSSCEVASGKLENLAGVVIAPSTLQRWALEMGKQVQRFEQVVVEPGEPGAARV